MRARPCSPASTAAVTSPAADQRRVVARAVALFGRTEHRQLGLTRRPAPGRAARCSAARNSRPARSRERRRTLGITPPSGPCTAMPRECPSACHLDRDAEHRPALRADQQGRVGRRDQLLDRRQRRAHADLAARGAVPSAPATCWSRARRALPTQSSASLGSQVMLSPRRSSVGGGQPALGRHAAVGDQEHTHARGRGDQPAASAAVRVHALLRRTDAHQSCIPRQGILACARAACASRQLLDRHSLPAQRDQERADLDLALPPANGNSARKPLLGSDCDRLVWPTENAQRVAKDHAGDAGRGRWQTAKAERAAVG